MERKMIQILSASLFIVMLLWGGYTLLYYLGVPVHGAVLLPDDVHKSLEGICAGDDVVCRGAFALFGVLWHSLTRVPFVIWYAVTCIVLYALVLAWRYVRTLRWNAEIVLKPWHVLALCFASMWLLFTCLSLSNNGDLPFNHLIEPLPDVYKNAGPQAIVALRENYDALKERGCLKPIGTFGAAEASEITFFCFQTSFFTRVVPPLIFTLLFLCELLVLGRFLLRKALRISTDSLLEEAVLSLGVGACTMVAALWVLAVAHVFIMPVGWALALLLPLVLFWDARYWLDRFLHAEWRVHVPWWSPVLLLSWFLLSYLAFNFINIVRPFPIGWDDLGSYLNRPRQLVSYGHFIFSMSAFQWEYLTALGFLLFGFESTFGATASLAINWTQGLLAVLIIMMFVRTYLGKGRGLLSATLYYTLPLVGHFSFADMKIDNAVFSMGALATFMLLRGTIRDDEQSSSTEAWRHILLAGVFVGFAFAMKVTAIMVLMALGAALAGIVLHPLGFVAGVIGACAVLIEQGALNLAGLLERVGYDPHLIAPQTVAMVFILIGLVPLAAAAYMGRARLRNFVILTAIFIGGFVAAVLPWMQYNNIVSGSIVPKIALGAPNTIGPILDMFGNIDDATYSLSPELKVDQKDPTCKPSGAREELGRYWGTRTGWGHYITLPFRSVMNLDSAGYYVTTIPALLLFPLLLLLPYFWRREGRWLRWVWLTTAFLIVEWMFLANGILWYGIGMFLGLVICLEALLARAPDTLNRSVAGLLITCSLLFSLGQRLWQYESQRNLFEYPLGKVSAKAIRERTIPFYDDITEVVLDRARKIPDRPLLFRVGTFMPYFVPRNLEVIGISDHQLDFFNCLYQGRDPEVMVARLKALGFNSIVFDTNAATIERDQNGSLHQKVQMFADFINNPKAGLQVVINDPTAGVAFILIP
ncbi:glycosyltransferase family 39 protein [Candidatus Peregrinibacteria bacterium]|nr:glycosyltransferase family 39 protein [Candidatus Peregrinibacteria bacterium]